MSEDAKAKLKEKMSAVVSDEDLEKVAGGTSPENAEIVTMGKLLDENYISALNAKIAQNPNWVEAIVANEAAGIVKKYLGSEGVTVKSNLPGQANVYFQNGKQISHEQVMGMLETLTDFEMVKKNQY